MKRYGILGRYLPEFGRIIGMMQYDLFHIYTVDAHTLLVVKNMRRLRYEETREKFPLACDVFYRLPKPELLYLAGLFHDIAKGRGGDHSELGAEDAYEFCLHHGLSQYDARLVAWLVRNHLLMSMTAQRKDISDPQVINDFARQVGDITHLDYLYLLTVADIRATNPTLWNSWRDALMAELYSLTKRALRRGLGNPIDEDELVRETQAQARRLLKTQGLHHMTVRSIWRRFSEDYFLRYSADEIAWHTAAIARIGPDDLPLVLINPRGPRGGTEVFIYTEDKDHVFAQSVATLDQLGLNIQDARIISTESGHTLDSYLVLESNGEPVSDPYRVQEIRERLRAALHKEQLPPPPNKVLPRRLRHFSTPTQINFSNDVRNNRTVLELITGDQPGLLARIGRVFSDCGVRLKNAKIATIGERAEDVFFITDSNNGPLSDPAQIQCIQNALEEALLGDRDKHQARIG